ncbi:MAG: HutD/Ves family protein [Rhodanobacteraceae bacterium]
MTSLRAIPRNAQREEPWANGAGSTTVILREPDDADWTIRMSVARVEHDGPFSDLPGTRRVLVPLDGPMTLRFPDGRELTGARFQALQFSGAPAPVGILPEGPTRDFNLMLRGRARGEVLPRMLVDTMVVPSEPGPRWLVYLDAGRATVHVGADTRLALNPHDAALVTPGGAMGPVRIEGAGEMVLVRLYA